MLLDISQVTETLISLLKKQIAASPEAARIPPAFNVEAMPPDKLAGNSTIGVYLYHITEDPHYKNLESPSSDIPPVRFTPMGLNLYYQLTAHSDIAGTPGAENEEFLVGLAMKAMHDYPVIDDTTTIAGVSVFPLALQGTNNRFRIVLQPVQHNEAMTYWTAGQLPMRLAVYYQVSVVLLQPESPVSRSSRVLVYGVFSFVRGAPYLEGSHSSVTFTIPGEATPRSVDVQPAEAPITGKVVFFGSDLSGDATTLLISGIKFQNAVEIGPQWGVIASDREIFATVGPTLGLITVVPGTYTAIAKVIERRVMPDKSVRDFPKTSNATPFVVTPRITAIHPPDLSQRVLVQGGVFQDAVGIAPDAVEVFVGANTIPLKAGAVLNPGEFEVLDATNLRFRYPLPNVASGSTVPFRLIINGAESAPNWVTAP